MKLWKKKEIMEEKEKKLQGKKFLLTYSKILIDKKEILFYLEKKVEIENYVLSEELDKKGSRHVHVLLI